MEKYAPLVYFAYSRLPHVRRSIESILENAESKYTDLIVYSDAPKGVDDSKGVSDVRAYLKTISGFKSITIIERPYNFGLALSIIDGVTSILKNSDQVIVLEDDIVVSPVFLEYMNAGLRKYKNYECIASIQSYVPPNLKLHEKLPNGFFLLGADCWGWATWKRAWGVFEQDGKKLLDLLKKSGMENTFNFNNSFPYTNMLRDQISGGNSSWAIRWYASTFLMKMLSFYPPKALVKNIGNDGSGTHGAQTEKFNGDLLLNPFKFDVDISLEDSSIARREFQIFFISLQPSIFNKLKLRFIASSEYAWRRFKAMMYLIAPPFMMRSLRKIRRANLNSGIRFDGPFESWDLAKKSSVGYGDESIFRASFDSALAVLGGSALFERDSVLFSKYQFSTPIVLGLMRAAAVNQGNLEVLDYGGGFASAYYRHLPFLKGVNSLRWHVVEQKRFAEAGAQLFKDENIKFHMTISEAVGQLTPNIVLISSALQYIENPYEIIDQISKIKPSPVVVIDRLPVSAANNDLIAIQKIPPSIYDASYPVRIFSKNCFLESFSQQWLLYYEELSPEGSMSTSNGNEFKFEGFVFCPRN